MLEVVTRKVGNSISISIPKKLNVAAGTEFVVYKSNSGSLIFSPKIKNPFTSNSEFKNDETKIWQDIAQEEWQKNV
ncbi:type II toxin-antitoxin system PemI/MazE family antitoxin [Enterococcus timonensis]|uniref:type II toxin-antitoxin system PemI/MazE family antitoxin n=1 Tax=Enterococcus timonensis TaxID=1852364 RepID=UPI0008D95802|nr:hypothetical protein [Enterococcus timonensis]